MAADRSRYGLLVASLGAILLAIAVFLPWYGVSLTDGGVAYLQQLGDSLAAQFGNAQLQRLVAGAHPTIGALSGQQLGAVSAHQVLKDMNIVLLVLAGLALVDALLPLAMRGPVPDGAGASLVVLGLLASACVAFRMFDRPLPEGGLVSLSLREGAWLALLGGLMILLGGMWPRMTVPVAASEGPTESIWTGLSGWTPQG